MVALRFSFLLLFGLVSCVSIADSAKVRIKNTLSQCIEIKSAVIEKQGTLLIAKLMFQPLASTAECGCKSKLNSFSVFIDDNNSMQPLMQGQFIVPVGNELYLPTAAQQQILGNNNVLISISCLLP